MSGNQKSWDAMRKVNKGKVAALDIEAQSIIKMTSERYKKLNQKGLAFTANHAVTRMFKEMKYNEYENIGKMLLIKELSEELEMDFDDVLKRMEHYSADKIRKIDEKMTIKDNKGNVMYKGDNV